MTPIATFTFKSGGKVVIGVDEAPQPIYLTITQGWRSVTQRLDRPTAQFWSYGAQWLARLTTKSLTLTDDGLIFHTKLALEKDQGLSAWIYSLTIWGNTYSYLRPGPLPPEQITRASEALDIAAHWPTQPPDIFPYTWIQP